MSDMFPYATAAGGEKVPYFTQLVGRLVVVEPKSHEEIVDDKGVAKPRLTADVTFLDGPTISTRKGRSAASVEVPVTPVSAGETMRAVWIDASVIAREGIRQLTNSPTAPRPLLGRLVQRPGEGLRQGAYVLEVPTPEEVETAGRWAASREAKKFAAAPAAAPVDPWA